MLPSFFTPVRYLKGIGPKRAQSLVKIGIETIEDVLYYFPKRYDDRSSLTQISKLKIGEISAVRGDILSKNARRSFKKGFDLFEISVGDQTGRIFCVWFNQPYLKNYFKIGSQVILYGKVELYKDRLQMSSPEFEIIDQINESLDVNRIVPVYSLPQGVSRRVFRKMVKSVLDEFLPKVKEALPFDIRSRHNLMNIAKSLSNIHFPESEELRLASYNRLSFEEFFIYQIPIILRKRNKKEKRGIAFDIKEKLLCDFIKILPFTLTLSQTMVFEEIKRDMSQPRPMQRLLQGDVGCGKTVIAMLAALTAVSNGYQVAFMVPTEILANQHYEKIRNQMSEVRSQKIKIALLASSLKDKEREKIIKELKDGKIDIIIGTHALIQEQIDFKNLGLIIIDEQHKFGVSQRALLPQKGLNPDVLIMTATPIPRTLSLTLYGDLDISFIRDMPSGRQPVKTALYSIKEKMNAYNFIRGEVQKGRQAFVVYPIIEDSPKLELASAKAMFEVFKNEVFKDLRVGLIHGRMKRQAQDSTMRQLKEGELDILVATTILEVGIDIPNATVILIEHADRFGLAQLHQMRGRVGRGTHESYCLLVADAKTEDASHRLGAMLDSTDGFKIAEEDLKIRGPGEFFGERQHGLTELKIANPLTQMHLLKSSREEVVRLLASDQKLENRQNQELKNQLYRRYPEFEKFIEVG